MRLLKTIFILASIFIFISIFIFNFFNVYQLTEYRVYEETQLNLKTHNENLAYLKSKNYIIISGRVGSVYFLTPYYQKVQPILPSDSRIDNIGWSTYCKKLLVKFIPSHFWIKILVKPAILVVLKKKVEKKNNFQPLFLIWW